MTRLRLLCFLVSLGLMGCATPTTSDRGGDILTMGDSMMAWNGLGGNAIPDVLAERLDARVVDRSIVGARIRYALPITGALGLRISDQFTPGNWDWVVINGGGNDLWLGCGCKKCERRMDKLIAEDGNSGSIPSMVAQLRQSGSRVIYVGYLRSPGVNSPIEHCRDEGEELDARLARMADLDDGITFVPLSTLVPDGDRSYHAFDMIHPSIKGSQAIADRVADVIRQQP